MSNRPRPQVGPPPRHDDLRALPDPQLLDVAVQCQVRKNRDTAREIETYAEMRRRCESDYEVRRARGPEHFVITPLDETALELAGALHVDEHKIKLDLMLRDKLAAWFPLLWDRCLSGRLDIGRARIVVDSAEREPEPMVELAPDGGTLTAGPDAVAVAGGQATHDRLGRLVALRREVAEAARVVGEQAVPRGTTSSSGRWRSAAAGRPAPGGRR